MAMVHVPEVYSCCPIHFISKDPPENPSNKFQLVIIVTDVQVKIIDVFSSLWIFF